jgi:hypothetical protein
MMTRSLLIVGVMLVSVGCQDKQDPASDAGGVSREVTATTEVSAPSLMGNPTVVNCTQQLASWLGEGLAIVTGESSATPSGCEFTAEVKDLDYDAVKAAVVSNLNKHGYNLFGEADVANGQRLTFRNGDYDISVLSRPSGNAKTKLEGGTARLDLHWYDRGAARAHKNSGQ